jgi:hypothetical protein
MPALIAGRLRGGTTPYPARPSHDDNNAGPVEVYLTVMSLMLAALPERRDHDHGGQSGP